MIWLIWTLMKFSSSLSYDRFNTLKQSTFNDWVRWEKCAEKQRVMIFFFLQNFSNQIDRWLSWSFKTIIRYALFRRTKVCLSKCSIQFKTVSLFVQSFTEILITQELKRSHSVYQEARWLTFCTIKNDDSTKSSLFTHLIVVAHSRLSDWSWLSRSNWFARVIIILSQIILIIKFVSSKL